MFKGGAPLWKPCFMGDKNISYIFLLILKWTKIEVLSRLLGLSQIYHQKHYIRGADAGDATGLA